MTWFIGYFWTIRIIALFIVVNFTFLLFWGCIEADRTFLGLIFLPFTGFFWLGWSEVQHLVGLTWFSWIFCWVHENFLPFGIIFDWFAWIFFKRLGWWNLVVLVLKFRISTGFCGLYVLLGVNIMDTQPLCNPCKSISARSVCDSCILFIGNFYFFFPFGALRLMANAYKLSNYYGLNMHVIDDFRYFCWLWIIFTMK